MKSATMKDACTQAGTPSPTTSQAWFPPHSTSNKQQATFSSVVNSGDYGMYAQPSHMTKKQKSHKVPSSLFT